MVCLPKKQIFVNRSIQTYLLKAIHKAMSPGAGAYKHAYIAFRGTRVKSIEIQAATYTRNISCIFETHARNQSLLLVRRRLLLLNLVSNLSNV